MDLDEALAVFLYLKDRPQTDLSDELRAIRQKAWVTIARGAQLRIDAELTLRSEARAAIQRLRDREAEDVNVWAEKIGNDLGKFTD
jgi:hypothetical protein